MAATHLCSGQCLLCQVTVQYVMSLSDPAPLYHISALVVDDVLQVQPCRSGLANNSLEWVGWDDLVSRLLVWAARGLEPWICLNSRAVGFKGVNRRETSVWSAWFPWALPAPDGRWALRGKALGSKGQVPQSFDCMGSCAVRIWWKKIYTYKIFWAQLEPGHLGAC